MKTTLLILILIFPLLLSAKWEIIDMPKSDVPIEYIFKVNDALVSYSFKSFYKSTDNGENWVRIESSGLDSVYDFEHIYTDGKDIYLLNTYIGQKNGVYKSSDNGENFELISSTKFSNLGINKGKIYLDGQYLLTTYDFVNFDTIKIDSKYRNIGDQHFKFINNTVIYFDKGVNSNNPPLVNNGIIYSNDDGKTWQEWNDGLLKNYAFNYDVHFTDSISFLGTSKGLYKSAGIGKKWEKIEFPSRSLEVKTLDLLNNVLYIATPIGEIFSSKDFGVTWDTIKQSPTLNTRCIRVIDNKIFAVGLGSYKMVVDSLQQIDIIDNINVWDFTFSNDIKYMSAIKDGIYYSDNDNKWEMLNDSLNQIKFNKNRIAVKDSIVYAIYQNNILSISRDLGKTWKDTNIISEFDYLYDIFTFNDVVILLSPYNLIISYDDGISWINIKDSDPNFNFFITNIVNDGNNFIASTSKSKNGLIISTDKCQTWEKLTLSDSEAISSDYLLHFVKFKNNIVAPKLDIFNNYISNSLYKSNDNGESWKLEELSNEWMYIFEMMNYKENIFMATTKGFIYSTNFGESWSYYNEGIHIKGMEKITNVAFRDLELQEGILYLTAANNIYTLPLSELGIDYTSVETTESRNYLWTNPPYPQPSNNQVKVEVYWDSDLPFTSDDVEIYDLTGIKLNINGQINVIKENNWKGNIIWDASNHNPGIYIMKITHGTETRTRKIIITK